MVARVRSSACGGHVASLRSRNVYYRFRTKTTANATCTPNYDVPYGFAPELCQIGQADGYFAGTDESGESRPAIGTEARF